MRGLPAPILILAAVLVTGCNGDDSTEPVDEEVTTAAPSSATTSTDVATSTFAGIPDGTWTREITVEDIESRGLDLPADHLVENYLADGVGHTVLKMQGARWTIFVQTDSGALEIGDLGGTSYDERGRWVQTGDGTGRVLVLEWEVDEDTLTTSNLTTPTGHAPPEDDERLALEGTWTLDE